VRLSAVLVILAAAVVHATWNLLAKGAGGGALFVWLYAVTSTVLWLPIVVRILARAVPDLTGRQWLFIVGSGLIHVVYFLVLQRGYDSADLSIVYPVARGSGPLIATAGAVAVYGERPSNVAVAGIGVIVCGILILAHPTSRRNEGVRLAVVYGLTTGMLIAMYTLWDKHAVATLAVSPLLMQWFSTLIRVISLSPLAVTRRANIPTLWRRVSWFALAIGALNPLAYLLVLIAMQFTPVSVVAPAREISVVVGVLFGSWWFREPDIRRRLAAAALTTCGIALLALG